MSKIIKLMKSLFSKHGDSERKANYERYFKGVVQFHGLVAKDIMKFVFKPVYTEIASWKLKKKINLAFKIMKTNFGDEKKIGVEILAKNVKKIMKEDEDFIDSFVTRVGDFVEDHVYDWGTADILGIEEFFFFLKNRVLCELIKLDDDDDVIPIIKTWKNACKTDGTDNDWLQRIACLARHGEHNDVIMEIVDSALDNQYRFTQLGAGWVLRELSLADEDRVVKFIKNNYDRFIREGLRYAIEKMEKGLRKELLEYGRKQTGKKRKRQKEKGSRKRRKTEE